MATTEATKQEVKAAVAAPTVPAKTAAPAVTERQYQFHPDTVNDAWALACKLAKSELIPRALRGKPEDVLIVMMSGHDFGLSAVQSFRLIHVIEGKLFTSAELMRALVLQSPQCEYLTLVKATATECVYKTKRRGGEEVVMSYTADEVAKAGLSGKDNHKKHPIDMLIARGSMRICRAQYPDVVGGINIDEERDEILGPRGGVDTLHGEISEADVVPSTDENRGHDAVMPQKNDPAPEPARVVDEAPPAAQPQSAAARILGQSTARPELPFTDEKAD